MSSGLCDTKYTPTPFERINRTTCSILSTSGFGAPLNNRCASSKNNTSFGRVGVARLGQIFEQLRHQPQQQRRVHARRGLHELRGIEQAHHAVAGEIGLHQIRQRQRRFAEQPIGTLLLQHEQAALNRADRRGGDVAVRRRAVRRCAPPSTRAAPSDPSDRAAADPARRRCGTPRTARRSACRSIRADSRAAADPLPTPSCAPDDPTSRYTSQNATG